MNQLLAAFLSAVLVLALLLLAASAELPCAVSKRRRKSKQRASNRTNAQTPKKELLEV